MKIATNPSFFFYSWEHKNESIKFQCGNESQIFQFIGNYSSDSLACSSVTHNNGNSFNQDWTQMQFIGIEMAVEMRLWFILPFSSIFIQIKANMPRTPLFNE